MGNEACVCARGVGVGVKLRMIIILGGSAGS